MDLRQQKVAFRGFSWFTAAPEDKFADVTSESTFHGIVCGAELTMEVQSNRINFKV